MSESLYAAKEVPADVRHLFTQLQTEFSEYQVWVRHENFGRTLLAAVVNRARNVAVTIPVIRPEFKRSREFESIEIGSIRSHLEIGAGDLALP